MSDKQYPIGGYAPGHYTCICCICKKEFQGDKRAVSCEPCALKSTCEPQLPRDMENEILRASYRKYNLLSQGAERIAYQECATEYATKLHQADEKSKLLIKTLLELEELKRKEIEDKLSQLLGENAEWKAECERLAGLVEFWQGEYNKLKGPSFTPPKIDNNPIA